MAWIGCAFFEIKKCIEDNVQKINNKKIVIKNNKAVEVFFIAL